MKLENIEHPLFEVHNFRSLANVIGVTEASAARWLIHKRVKLLCGRFSNWSNMFVISKKEIEKLKSRKPCTHWIKPKKKKKKLPSVASLKKHVP